MGLFIYWQKDFYIIWLIYFLVFVPGQQQKYLHFCTKPNKIMENNSKKKIIMFNIQLIVIYSPKEKKEAKWKNICKNEHRLWGMSLQFKM